MSLQTVEDVLYHALKDLLSAEKQFKSGLKKLADAANDKELSTAFSDHREETIEQISKLEKCFDHLGRAERSEKCDAADGLTKEAEGMIKEDGEPGPKDLAYVSAGRKTEHYEIASYEDAISLSKQLGHSEVTTLLQEILEQEKAADKKLKSLGQTLAKRIPQTV